MRGLQPRSDCFNSFFKQKRKEVGVVRAKAAWAKGEERSRRYLLKHRLYSQRLGRHAHRNGFLVRAHQEFQSVPSLLHDRRAQQVD